MTSAQDLRVDRLRPDDQLARDVGLARHFMAADLVARGEGWKHGVRSVLLQNDIIAIEVVVDRALDIYSARIRQLPVGWLSPTGIVAPWFIENHGFGTQRAFFGGLLTTCGLDHIGPPVERSAERYGYASRSSDHYPMHGRIGGSPAELTGYGVRQRENGLEAFVEGRVVQVSVFGEHLVMHRRVSIRYGSAQVCVEDRVMNEGYAASPLAMLYHVNVGWPIISPSTKIYLPTADRGEGHPLRYPERGTAERVSRYPAEATDGSFALAGIVNPQVSEDVAAGVAVRWRTEHLPTMLQWDVANIAGHYAVGLEPSTLLPPAAAANGEQFPSIEAGEAWNLGVTLELLHGPAGSDFGVLAGVADR